MVEQYGELLWQPLDVTDAGVTLEHYDLGVRRIEFISG
jgi:hypothetical protein